MPYYEVLCLAHGRLARKELGDLLHKTCKSFMEQGAIVTRLTAMGADGHGPRKLAYRIRKNQVNHKTGFYVNVGAFATPEALAEVDRRLKLDERVLRHKTLKLPLKSAIVAPPDMDEKLTKSTFNESDPQYALRTLIEQNARDYPDGFQFAPEEEDFANEGAVRTDPGLQWLSDKTRKD